MKGIEKGDEACAAMKLLIERTIDTGQQRLSPLSEVDPDILAHQRPLVRQAIKSGLRWYR